jgi:hypothetical protein
MTIIHIHGVTVRDPAHGQGLERPFQRWLGPKLSVNQARPGYDSVFWGDSAASFRWELDSRPRTKLLQQGAASGFRGLGSLRNASRTTPLDTTKLERVSAGPVLGRPAGPQTTALPPLSTVPRADRGDFLADLYLALRAGTPSQKQDELTSNPLLAALADAAEAAAADWDNVVAQKQTEEDQANQLLQILDSKLDESSLIAQGGTREWLTRTGETLRRATYWPVDAVSTVFAELRPSTHNLFAYFIGDAFMYLANRELNGGPGEIPNRVLVALRRAHTRKKATGERIVVVTHSMGGQLLYDAVTHFAPKDPVLADLTVDHWITCGSQVSFFAELGLFLGQSELRKPKKLQRPKNVLNWTNFYDPNDLVGFVMSPVFEGVRDIEYDTGYGLAFSHSGYLARPSFFRALAALF